MSVQIVLPNLQDWVEERVKAIYTAKNAEDFDGAFDAFVAKDVTIKVNGKSMSRDAYKKMVQGQITADVGADVTFNGIVSVPSEDKDLRAIGVRAIQLSSMTVWCADMNTKTWNDTSDWGGWCDVQRCRLRQILHIRRSRVEHG